MTKNFSETPEISLINNAAAFPLHWRGTTDSSTLDTVYTSELICQKILTNNSGIAPHWRYSYEGELRAYESPLEEGIYRIWVAIAGYSGFGPSSQTLVRSYSLALPPSDRDEPIWRQRTGAIVDRMGIGPGIPYSGHKVRYGRGDFNQGLHGISDPQDPSQMVEVDLPESGPYPHPHISTYSGALTYYADMKVVVLYFK